jgi:hypothetical protein
MHTLGVSHGESIVIDFVSSLAFSTAPPTVTMIADVMRLGVPCRTWADGY